MSRQYIFVGNWRSPENKSGISLFLRNSEGEVSHIGDFFEEVTVGQMAVDAERKLLYFTDECTQNKMLSYYGGSLLAARIKTDPPELELISRVPTLTSNPADLCLDESGRFALVAHHVGRNHVVRIRKNGNGEYAAEKQYDPVTLCLVRLEEDGSVGPIVDMVTILPEGDRCPHLHSVVTDPSFACFAVCDKGLDKVYSFGIDRERGKLIRRDTADGESGAQPRYGVFHPTLPVLYTNYENAPMVDVWNVDKASGALRLLQRLDIPCKEAKGKIMPSDILLSENGKTLYVSIRGSDEIAVINVGEAGELTWNQSVPCYGENPRGLALDRETGKLYCANCRSGEVCVFETEGDGMPVFNGMRLQAAAPGCVAFMNV